MKIVDKKTSELIPYINNPRYNEAAVDAVASSIKNFGFKQPIVIDKNNEIVAGHTRLLAAKKLGLESVPCLIADDLNEAQIKAFRLADNKVSELATWNMELLDNELHELSLEEIDFDMSEFGFDPDVESFKDLQYKIVENEEDEVKIEKEIYSRDEIIEEAFSYFRENGFPYPQMTLFEKKQEINNLANLDFEKLPRSNVAHLVADTYNLHRYECSAINMKSPLQAFQNEKDLKKAIEFEYPKIKHNTLPFISLVNGTQSCSNFRPAFCRYVLEKYGVDYDVYLDPCMGFGGRMVGFFSSKYKTYISTDPSSNSYKNNIRMKQDLLPKGKEVVLYNEPFEELNINEYKGKVDIVFTSPPYFNKELYADEETQSMIKFSNYDSWKTFFLKVLIEKSFEVLKENRYFILNIEDTNIKGVRYSLVEDSIELGKKTGFIFEKREEFGLQTRTMLKDGQKLTVDGKESVLLFKKR